MFDNIEKKIKDVATIFLYVGVIGSIILCITIWIIHNDVWFFNGLLYGICCFVGTIVSCYCLYGFGELIEHTKETKENSKKIYRLLNEKVSNESEVNDNNKEEIKQPKIVKMTTENKPFIKKDQNKNWECRYCGYINPASSLECDSCQRKKD